MKMYNMITIKTKKNIIIKKINKKKAPKMKITKIKKIRHLKI